MRKARTIALVAAVLGLVGAVGSTGMAGPPLNPNWFNDPVEGPSPNPTHEVGNLEGGECPPEIILEGFGPAVLGGATRHFVVVRLKSQDDTTELHQETYAPDEAGFWGGPFVIPPGLEPGVYPLEATCFQEEDVPNLLAPAGFGRPVSLGGGVVTEVFHYEDRSYTVLAPEEPEPAKPVVRVVTFTG